MIWELSNQWTKKLFRKEKFSTLISNNGYIRFFLTNINKNAYYNMLSIFNYHPSLGYMQLST